THNSIIEFLKQPLQAEINVINISNHRNTGCASPARSHSGRSRVITVDVKCARVYDPFASKLVGIETQLLVAPPKDRPFAAAVHQDHRLLARATRNCAGLRLYSRACE